MAKARKICVVTGSRAEYGLLRWLMADLAGREDVELQVIACAMHLAPEFGHTLDLIRADGFTIDAEVPMLAAGDTPAAMAQSIGLGVSGFTNSYEKLSPDLTVVLGDRFEILAAVVAATTLQIPVAHIHGGETTEGAVDEVFRHAITKMAHLHFAAAPEYGQRIIQMGEAPDRVFVVGAPGLDNFLRLDLLDRAALGAALGLDVSGCLFLLGYHSETAEKRNSIADLDQVLTALDQFEDAAIIATKANADFGGESINAHLQEYADERPGRVVLHASLGQVRYLSALKAADVVVGNSSSGIIEAPAAGTPTVNVGNRQKGRLRAASIIDCAPNSDVIVDSIQRAIDPSFMAACASEAPPYGAADDTSSKIAEVVATHDLAGLVVKPFHDLGGEKA